MSSLNVSSPLPEQGSTRQLLWSPKSGFCTLAPRGFRETRINFGGSIMTRHRRRGAVLGAVFLVVLLAGALSAEALAGSEKQAVREFEAAVVVEGKPKERGHSYG